MGKVTNKNLIDENNLIEKLRDSIEQAKGFLLEELIKIGTTNSNKSIDVNDNNVKQAIQSLIYADPDNPVNRESGGGTLSIIATIKDNEKKINKWIEEDYAPEVFDKIRKEMQDLPDKLKKELSTQQGIDTLVNERVKNNTILQQIPFFIDDDNNIRGTTSTEKNKVINKVKEHIKIPQTVVSTLLQDRALLKPLIEQITKNATKFFGKEGVVVNNACVLDEKKLTSENILKFAKETNHNIKAFEVMQQSLHNLDYKINVDQNQEITQTLLPVISNLLPEELEKNGPKIIKNIAPALKEPSKLAKITKSVLSKLDTGYITNYSEVIINGLQEVNNKGTSFLEKIKSVFTGKDYLKERLEKSVNTYAALSDEYVKKLIDGKIFSNALKDNELIYGLTNFINENKNKHPELQNVNPNEIQNNKSALVSLRRINPADFDKTVFEDAKKKKVTVEPPTTTPNSLSKNRIRNRG